MRSISPQARTARPAGSRTALSCAGKIGAIYGVHADIEVTLQESPVLVALYDAVGLAPDRLFGVDTTGFRAGAGFEHPLGAGSVLAVPSCSASSGGCKGAGARPRVRGGRSRVRRRHTLARTHPRDRSRRRARNGASCAHRHPATLAATGRRGHRGGVLGCPPCCPLSHSSTGSPVPGPQDERISPPPPSTSPSSRPEPNRGSAPALEHPASPDANTATSPSSRRWRNCYSASGYRG